MKRIRIRFFLILIPIFLMLSPFIWRYSMVAWASGRTFNLDEAPSERVAVVFGARVYRNGRLSPMLRDRVQTAVDLYFDGKIEKIIMSGGEPSGGYNEPDSMAAYALAQGVPAADIQTDYGGNRTYDTCYRTHYIFGVEEAILVTQEFHLARALITCQSLGVDVSGVIADRRVYSDRSMAFSTQREFLASQLALVDILLQRPSEVLGEPVAVE